MSKHFHSRERAFRWRRKIMRNSPRRRQATNADYIRRLSDEGLAFFICAMVFDGLESLHDNYSITYAWLQEPDDD